MFFKNPDRKKYFILRLKSILASSESSTGKMTMSSPGTKLEFSAKSEDNQEIEIKLNEIISEAVFQGLSHFGGENVVESLLYILELDHSVDLGNIGKNLDALQTGLDQMFGNASYVVLGHICADLAKKLGLDPSGRTLEELVDQARKSLKALMLQESGGYSK